MNGEAFPLLCARGAFGSGSMLLFSPVRIELIFWLCLSESGFTMVGNIILKMSGSGCALFLVKRSRRLIRKATSFLLAGLRLPPTLIAMTTILKFCGMVAMAWDGV